MTIDALRRSFLLLALAGVLSGCASPLHQAPVVDHRHGATLTPGQLPSGVENAGKPGYYTVKPGDTVYHIATENKQTWQDIVAWNKLDNPNVIEVGQVLRVVPPNATIENTGGAVASTRAVTAPAKVESRPLDKTDATKGAAAAAAASGSSSAEAGAIDWMWPTSGAVISSFDNNAQQKGIDLAGKLHDPVFAAAAGRVVYAGSGLKGYGNVIVIKHNADYITAYAHNDVLLVKEGDAVQRGQKIAEMGSSEANRVELHFELRKQGTPIDPTKVLPPR